MHVETITAPVTLGAIYPQAEIGNDPGFIKEYAQTAEALGFAYLTAFDHILGADASRFDGPVGGFPGPAYVAEDPFHEVFTLFSFLASATSTLRFRPRVVILPQRETALVAKQATTLDRLSGGRLTMAVGVGWNFAEYEGVGADFTTRGKRLDEQIQLMRRLWSEPLVTFDGRWHHLDRVGINPLPNGGSIPLWIGSGPGEASLRRVAEHADGWIALLTPAQDLGQSIARVHELRAEADRSEHPFGVETLVSLASGTPDDWHAEVHRLAALGITEVCLATGRKNGRTPAQHFELLTKGAGAFAD